MRIERIEAEAIAIPLTRDFGGSTYHVTRRSTVITRAYSQDGVVGEVYNGDNRNHAPDIARMIVDKLAPLVLGEDPFAVERLWQKLFTQSIPAGDRKILLEAIACVDCPAVKNGMFTLPDGSGFGIELDRKLVAKYRVNG